jgi:Protein of unknown function (DUF2839)
MGESKRRKEALGEKYGQDTRILPWLPFTKRQSEQFMQWTSRGAWIGIGTLAVIWIVVIFIGPSLGWWNTVP